MATFLDNLIGPIARDTIRLVGASVTYTRVVVGAYDPATSSVSTTETPYSIKALVEDYSLVDSGAGFASGLIEFGDKRVTIAQSEISVVPTAGDKITHNGETYTVVRVQKTYSGDNVALFELQARK